MEYPPPNATLRSIRFFSIPMHEAIRKVNTYHRQDSYFCFDTELKCRNYFWVHTLRLLAIKLNMAIS